LPFTAAQLADLPSTYYRVSAKALIFDGDKLLIFKDKHGQWELPGGGWEHDESLDECLRRELKEEMNVALSQVGEIELCWRNYPEGRAVKLCVAARATLASHDFVPSDDDLVEARFVSLPFQASEQGAQTCVDAIWALSPAA